MDVNYPPVTGSWYLPDISASWQWQLSGTVNTSYDVTIYDIDLFDAAHNIATLQEMGKKVICYFSAGSSENWRPDFADFLPADMGNDLAGWPGERWLDVRSQNVRSIMQARLDLAAFQGCDGVEPDNMDGYTNKSGFNFTADDQLDYNRFIANEAHLRGLSVGLKNDVEQIGALVQYYDFAVNEQCFQYAECDVYKIFTDLNKPVFNAEYPAEDSSLNTSSNQQALCQQAAALNIRTLILPLNLNDSFRISCD
ncbi:MAG: endo alpha-1,4 polygalactosaminidase [Gammaproteobacteria bacterium]|nr:endo alpha-1,4 polygalactosaminidase [Gammaproteobacteria bacterium]